VSNPQQPAVPGGPTGAQETGAGGLLATDFRSLDSPGLLSSGGESPGAAIEVDNIGWTVGGAVILAEITLTIGKGELLAVIGPNGAGKSTLVNMISGASRPTTGRILLDGRDVTKLPVRLRARAGIGRTFQTSSLFDGLTCLQNVCFALQSATSSPLNPLRRAVSPAMLDDGRLLLDRVGMGPRATWSTAALSHGDKRKLELAVAMARRPEVLLLDEPMAGVSMEDVPGLVQLIAELNQQGVTVCMVEHHMHVVLGLADRIAVLHHGRLLAIGSPAEVMADQTVKRAYLGDAL
jgi:branched-chain amino acid transport system ATP-binding protein